MRLPRIVEFVTESSLIEPIDTHMKNLRHKLHAVQSGGPFILSIYGVG